MSDRRAELQTKIIIAISQWAAPRKLLHDLDANRPHERGFTPETWKHYRIRRQLWQLARYDPHGWRELFDEQPNATSVQVGELVLWIRSGIAQLNRLSPHAVRALSRNGCDLIEASSLPDILRRFECVGEETYSELVAARPPGRGRPVNLRAKAVTYLAAQLFSDLTGQKPTTAYDAFSGERKSKFISFLDVIFRLLAVDGNATAESQAAAYVGRHRMQEKRSEPIIYKH